ncbi:MULTISPECIES: hypothetical protein [unclassified Microbacterium]|uniref:hypothetical protein n=1 Tax=unclassified Microbacterium TaxID=2609290 RepID=UPI00214CB7B7|nr:MULTISPECIES: hypothetical protein [unclassified Microbacterium]MCR2783523.1 hypothetical protein [Microbacterium sp. zg.B96]WIM15616.1 hypothetical protein QNO11_13910 [Microbacterium sp. zg-B96]
MSHISEPGQLGHRSGPLQHPLDIPAARRSYMAATVLDWLCSPLMLCSAVLTLLATSNNTVTPLLSSAVTLGLIALLERHHRTEAWAHIPRKRQDSPRPDAVSVAAAGAAAQVALLAVAMSFFGHAVTAGHAPAEAVSLGIGVVLGTAALAVGTAAWDASRHAVPAGRMPPIVAIPTAAFVAGLGLVALASWPTSGSAAMLMAIGAAFAVAVQVACWMLRLIPTHSSCGLPALVDRLATSGSRR